MAKVMAPNKEKTELSKYLAISRGRRRSSLVTQLIETVPEISVHKYTLPTLTSEFPVKLNPLSTRPENQEWIEWLAEYSLMTKKQFEKIKCTAMNIHYMNPFCDDIHRYELLIKYFVNFFILDDHTECNYGEIARNQEMCTKVWTYFGQVLDKLEGKSSSVVSMVTWKPYVISMYSSLEPVFQTLNEVQRRRFIEGWRGYMEGNLEETEFIEKKMKFTSIEQYNQIRCKSIGLIPTVQMIEFADQIFVPEHVWEESRFQELLTLSSIHVIYVNDIFSFEKETKETDDLNAMFNIVAVITLLEGTPIEESMERAAEIVGETERKIFELEEQLINDDDCLDVTKVFIDRLNHVMGGNVKVSTTCDRYHKLEINNNHINYNTRL